MSSNSKATSSASGSANSTNSSTDTSSIKTLYYAKTKRKICLAK